MLDQDEVFRFPLDQQLALMEKAMLSTRTRRSLARALPVLATIIIALGACNSVQVRTLVAPGADFKGRTTFKLLSAKMRANAQLPPNDPMLVNSITYRRMRAAIRTALENKGYKAVEDGESMDVAYYASAREKLDVRSYDYGYRWRRWPQERTEVYQYTQGTVIVDIIDPASKELLWRGQGRAEVSDDPDKFAEQVEETANKILEKFPAAAQ
jgi:hypothetical protein